MHDIDFVVTWVDQSDLLWQAQFQRFYAEEQQSAIDAGTVRYRDWDLLRFWFRGIEKFAPWVRYIHFVTFGHVPSWLDTTNPKLRIVHHEDYIPKEYLPLFNSNPIELMMHRIPDLAEHFVYFNDDFFLTQKVEPSYFFKQGLPCDTAIISNHRAEGVMDGITQRNRMIILNKFDVFSRVKKDWKLWFNLNNGKFLYQTLFGLIAHRFNAPADTHAPQPYLRSIINEIWEQYELELSETMTHRFRTASDYSHWLFRYWQILDGRIAVRNVFATTKSFYNLEKSIDLIDQAIVEQRYAVLVLNDCNEIQNLEQTKLRLHHAFSQILNEPSKFEIM